MNKPVTVFVDSGKAVARLSGPLVLGDTYAVTFSGLSTEEAASAPEMIVLGPKPREIAARSGTDGVLAMTTKPCVEAFGPLPPPPLPRPKQFPHPPPLANPPVHWRGGPHGSTRMHFYVVAGGQTLAQGDLVLLWAPFEYDDAGEPIQLKGAKGDPGEKGEKGEKGDPGEKGVYVAMDGLYAFHISEGGDHPEDGHLWLHAQDESTLYAHDANGNYLLDENGERIPLYYVGDDGHLRYRFFFQDSKHVELDLGKIVTREGLYAFHVSDGSDGEPAGHLMLHGQDLSQLYARDGKGNLILDGNGDPIPLFHIDANGHLHFTFYGNDGQAHESLDLGDVRGPALTWSDLTSEQKAALKGEKGDEGDKGDKGDPLTWDDLTDEQKASLKGQKGDPGEDGMDAEEIVTLVENTMGEADDAPTAGSKNWVTSGGLWSVEQAILARIMALATQITAIASKAGGALYFKGSVQSASDLPEDGNEPGDTYDVIDEGGVNYAWTGSEWNALGATIALSAYRTAAAQDAIDGAQDAAIAAKYTKPATGIPAGDLASDVQTALTNARTPTAHAATHAANGTDPITPASLGAVSSDEFAPVEQVVSQLPSPSEILSLDAYNNVRKNGTELTVPPSIYGHELALQDGIAPAFSTSSTYAVGDYCTHEGLLYKCTTAVSTAGAWNAANWSAASAMAEMPAPVDTSNFVQWANNNKNAVTIGTRASGSTIGASSLSVGDGNTATANQSASIGYNNQSDGKHALAVGQDNRTVNDNAFAVGESCYAWGKDSFAGGYLARTNPNNYGGGHWGAFVWNGGGGNSWYSSHGDGTFNVKTQGGTSGFYIGETTLAALLGAKAESADLRYAFASPTPTVSGTAATVACEDRAINDFTVATGITSLTITPPAAVTGRARDFFCRVTLTDSSLPTVTLSGGTIDIGSTEVAGMTQGVNLLMFTEISSGHWLASRRSAS